jgi:hypothetical protein
MESSIEVDGQAGTRPTSRPVVADEQLKTRALVSRAGASLSRHDEPRVSFDPMRATDRYRLVMPYSELPPRRG